eukprot:GHUV01042804.1.p1 GENE.GHUV01042804.1~~GHUV01042804.1.p1  ORF type:complete len:114 (+),score=24.79 GHUV01042804.1:245-586(+)
MTAFGASLQAVIARSADVTRVCRCGAVLQSGNCKAFMLHTHQHVKMLHTHACQPNGSGLASRAAPEPQEAAPVDHPKTAAAPGPNCCINGYKRPQATSCNLYTFLQAMPATGI